MGPSPVTMAVDIKKGTCWPKVGGKKTSTQKKKSSKSTAAHFPRSPPTLTLHEEAQHGEHGETPVLDLLDLQLGEGVRVVSEPKRVKTGARVQAVEALVAEAGGAAVDAVALVGKEGGGR
jgi:hypothetical protein